MSQALQKAYKSGDAQMIQRILVLLDYSRGDTTESICQKHGIARASLYAWLKHLLLEGLASLKSAWKGGRPTKLSPNQKKELAQLLEAGPQAAGYPTGSWSAILIQDLIWQRFEVLYNVHYLCNFLKTLGFSYQKARFISEHLDEAQRLLWLKQSFPEFKAAAQRAKGLLLFGDEVSFAQWGSLSYTWARTGQQPQIPTSGKRKSYKVFGLIDLFTGRFFYQGSENRLNSASYIDFLKTVLAQSHEILFLVQDGARYHTSKETKAFFQAHAARLQVLQLPSYSPDYNPIELLWRALKRRSTHNLYFPDFTALVNAVEAALAYFQSQATYIQSLFGFYQEATDSSKPELSLAA